MTQQHSLDDADLVDLGDVEDFEGDPSDDFADDKDFADDEDFVDDEEFVEDDDLDDDDAGLDDDDAGLDDDDAGLDDDDAGLDDDDAVLEDDDDDDVPPPADDDDDDEEVHPSDVEADLEEILRDRIAASDDDEEDEEEDPAGPVRTVSVVAPPRSDEWTCNQCFLIVSMTQFGSRANPVCPSGEEPCESIKRIFSG